MAGGGFARRLAVVVAAGLAIRLLYALVVMAGIGVAGDGVEYHVLANALASEGRFLQVPAYLEGRHVPTAGKPPLYSLALAVPSALGLTSLAAHRVAACLMGAALVAGVGLLGRRVGGDRVGLVAASVAAAYPLLVVLDGAVRSESLYAPLIAFALLAAYRLADRPTAGRAAVLGALVGLAALTRVEALVLLGLLVVPVARLLPPGRRLRAAAVATAAALVVMAPWLARNWAVFDRPLPSTSAGGLVYGANCHAAYSGPLIGTWPCFPRIPPGWGTDEAEISDRLWDRAVSYARDNAGRLPAVVAVRVLRMWELWDPVGQAELEHGIADRNLRAEQAGVAAFYVLAALAVAGPPILRRRGAPLRVLLAPAVLVTLLGAFAYGSTRFRVAAEVPIVVLAAVAVVHLAERRRRPAVGPERPGAYAGGA